MLSICVGVAPRVEEIEGGKKKNQSCLVLLVPMSSSSGNEEDSEADHEWEELDASQREGEAAAVVLSTCVICTCSI